MLRRRHVDKVDDNQTAHVTQAQLTGDFLCRFQVGLERGFLDILAFRGAGRVDVDGNQGLGRINHDGAAGGQFHFPLEGGLDLAFDLVPAEQRDFILVQLDLVFEGGHDCTHEIQDVLIDAISVNQNLADVLAKVVTDRTDDNVAFLVNQEGCLALAGGLSDGLPELHQVVQIPLEFFSGTADAGGTNDDAHGFRHLNIVHRFFELRPLIALNATGDAAGTGVVGHEYQIATCQGDKRGQGCALIATLFLVDLHNYFLAFGNNVLDVDFAFDLAGRLLEVFLGNFLQRQKAVALGAEIHKRGLETGLDPGNAALVDIGFLLLAGAGFDIKVE